MLARMRAHLAGAPDPGANEVRLRHDAALGPTARRAAGGQNKGGCTDTGT